MLAVGISAAALAAGSYFVVRHNLLTDSVDSSVWQARRNLAVAPAYLPRGHNALLTAYQRGGDFLTVGIQHGRPFQSSFSVGGRQVPSDLRRLVAQGNLGYERLILSACNPLYSASQRWVVFARAVSVTLPGGRVLREPGSS